MLKKLRIQNFKVWEDTGEIDLAPITLFFGANSSGKSHFGLLSLKEISCPLKRVKSTCHQ